MRKQMNALQTAINVGTFGFGLATNPVGTVVSSSLFRGFLFKLFIVLVVIVAFVFAMTAIAGGMTSPKKQPPSKKKTKKGR